MAAELGPLGIRVNAVAPGFIDVPSTHGALSADRLRDYAQRTPLGVSDNSRELCEAICDAGAKHFINGVVLPVDGGLRL